MKKFKFVGISVLLVLFLIGCVGCSFMGLKGWADLTPKQKGIFFMNTYLSTAENVDMLLKDPASTSAVKASAAKDKATLTELYPLIKSYKKWAETGVMDVPISEDMILKLIDKLVNKL